MAETNVNEEKLDLTMVIEIIEKYKNRKGPLMPALQEIQDHYGYISTKFIDIIADGLNVYPSQIFGVLTFYSMFYLNPRGKFIIRVCRGTACHVKGSLAILEEIKRTLEINNNETTIDKLFSLESVACIGACSMAPIITIGDKTHGIMTSKKAIESINNVRVEYNISLEQKKE